MTIIADPGCVKGEPTQGGSNFDENRSDILIVMSIFKRGIIQIDDNIRLMCGQEKCLSRCSLYIY